MENLFRSIMTIAILGTLMKVGLFYLTLKVKSTKPVDAKDVIRCRGMHPELHKKMINDMIIDHTRDEEIEKAYKVLVNDFKFKLQTKQLSRGKILGIEEYLRKQLSIKRKYNDNAHAIYSMLKSESLTQDHISTISKFIA